MTSTTTSGLMCAFLLYGCQVGVDTPVQAQADGLTMFSADRATGLTGMYKAGDAVVFFETITDPPDEPGDHRVDHGQDASRPMFSSRWTDADGRTIAMTLSGSSIAMNTWTEVDPDQDRRPEQWDSVLDLAKQAAATLQAHSVSDDVREELAQLTSMTTTIPVLEARIQPATDEQLAQIEARDSGNRAGRTFPWFQEFSVYEGGFHQCTGWANYYYYSGAWHYHDSVYQNNGATCDHPKCGPVATYVQGYKSDPGQCDGGGSTYYGMCDFWTSHHYNCRSSALREQTWVTGNRLCSSNSQDNGTMCAKEENLGGGAFCGWHTTCSNDSTCN